MAYEATKFVRGAKFVLAARQYFAEAVREADAQGLPRAYNLPLDACKSEGENVVIPRFTSKKKLRAARRS